MKNNQSQEWYLSSITNQLKNKIKINDYSDCVSTQKTISEIKFQNIIYYCWDGKKDINAVNNVTIDFIGAMSEMKNIDYTFDKNFIGFENKNNNEQVQFIRIGKDFWYADITINSGVNWDGYYWAGYGSTIEIADMLKLFFEEVPWFDSISWVMRRHK